MRIFLLALVLVFAVMGCGDGKLNLLIVFWGEHEESSSSMERIRPEPQSSSSSSSIIVAIPSSSSEYVPSSSSSSSSEEEPPPSSSSEEISSSSLSSSSRPARSSSSKDYGDYPPLEIGDPKVKKGVTTRYWDGCRPSCSYIGNIDNNKKPWVINRACDKNGYNEMPLLYLEVSTQWETRYTAVPSALDHNDTWAKSKDHDDWASTHPDFPKGSNAYTCFDMTPYTVNDTLAYAFVATQASTLACGECAALQFDGEWPYDMDKDGESKSRVTHRALKGKTLIVMANNTGTVGENHFDIMFPGGGLGANDCFSEQIGLPAGSKPTSLGHVMGGLLSECSYNEATEFGKPSDRFTLAEWQKCLSDRCHRAFDRLTKTGEKNILLEGCLWSADWLYAADNPNVNWTKVECPKYLVDKYNSTVTTELPGCFTSNPKTCQITGVQTN